MADVTLTLGANTREIEAAINRLSKKKVNLGGINSKNFTVPLGRIQGQLGEFNKSLQASNARVLAFGASAGAIFAVQQAFSQLVKSTINVEKQLAEINVVLGTSQKSLKSFGDGLFNAAAKAGMGFDAAAEAATEFSRQGLGLEKTLERVNDALVLSRLTGLSVADSVNAITAAINGYNLSLKEQENLTSRIIAVDQAFAVSGADIAEAMRRVASTAQGAGVSLNELIAIVTAAQQKTARGGAVIGNSFKTIFTRLQRPRTLEALDQLGIKVKDASGAMLPAMQVMQNLAKTFDTLTHAQKSNVAQLVGGVFQINVLKAAIGDLSAEYSIYGNALSIANSATDEASQRNEELNKTMAAQLNALVQNVTRVAAAIGDLTIAPALEKIVSGLNAFLGEGNEGEAEGFGSRLGTGILKGIGAVLSGPGLLMLGVGLFKLFQFLGKQAKDAVKTIMQMGKATEKRMALEDKVLQTLMAEPAILEKINKGEMSIAKLHDEILKDIQQENTLLIAQEKLSKTIAANLSKRTILTGSGESTALAPRPRRAAGYIPNYANPLEMERREAMRRGASPRVRGYYDPKVKIKGRRGAIVNTEEDVIHNFARGESAVIPRYNVGRMPRPAADESVPTAAAKSTVKGKLKKLSLPADLIGVISVQGAKPQGGGLVLTPSDLQSAKGPGIADAKNSVAIHGINHFRPKKLAKNLHSESYFKDMVKGPMGEAAVEIARKLLGTDPDEIPSLNRLGDIVTRDTTAYPQFAGRMLESALTAAIVDPNADASERGPSTWDFQQQHFNNRKTAIRKMFSQGDRLLNTKLIESKLNLKSKSYMQSMGKKIGNTPEIGSQLRAKAVAAAGGYIPNFANALGDAISREHDAGIPYNQMRIHTDKFGRPTAVTNKKDEPNGLKDVRRKSSGYIPNFASLKADVFKALPNWFESFEAQADKFEKAMSEAETKMKKARKASENLERKKAKLARQEEKFRRIANDATKTSKQRERALRAANRASQQAAKTEQQLAATRLAASRQQTAMNKASAGKAKAQQTAQTKSRVGGGAMAMTMLAPMLGELVGASEHLSSTLTNMAMTVGVGAMAMEMIPGKAGLVIGGFIMAAGALHFLAKHLGTMKFQSFKRAAEDGKEQLERFNASAQAAATAMSEYDAELKKASPDAKRLLSFQDAYATALSELPAALRAQVLSSNDLAAAQEALAKAQMDMAKKQKGRELAAQLAETKEAQTGFTSAYGVTEHGGAIGLGAGIGALVGSIAGPVGTAIGAAAGGMIGKIVSVEDKSAQVFGSGEDAINLGAFTQDVAKSIDFKKLMNDPGAISNLMANDAVLDEAGSGKMGAFSTFGDLEKGAGTRLAAELEANFGASKELADMIAMLNPDDVAVFVESLQLAAIKAKRAHEEAAVMNKLLEEQAKATAKLNEAIAKNKARIDSWLQALTAVTKAREAFDMEQDKASRKYWTEAAKSVRDLNKVFLTDEGNAVAASQMKDFAVNNKLLDDLGKIQGKTRDGMISAIEKSGGEAGLSDDVLKQIRDLQNQAVTNGTSNVDLMKDLMAIQLGNGKKLGDDLALSGQMTALIHTQNSEMKTANHTAQVQLAINKMQLDAQKKQIQISKDIKTLGGLNTFMDPEGAGKKKAEDFEKGLEGFGKGAARGDVMQQGRGAVQLLRSAMDAGVDIMGPDGAAFKQQAIDANAGFLRNTFTDRANRLNQQAAELDAMGRGGEAQQLRDQASGYMAQAGRADEIAENQVMAEFKKAKMPENIAEIRDIDRDLLTVQRDSLAKREQDFLNALNNAGIVDATQQVENAIAIQSALIKQQEALKKKQEAETKKKAQEEAQITADAIVGMDRTAGFTQMMSSAGVGEDSGDALLAAMGVKRDENMWGQNLSDQTRNESAGFETILKNLVAGSGGEITNLRQLTQYSPEKLRELYTKGMSKTGMGENMSLDNFEQIFGSGELLEELFEDGSMATKEYMKNIDEMMSAFGRSQAIDKELTDLTNTFSAANAALQAAIADVNTAEANAAANAGPANANPAIATNIPAGATANLPSAQVPVQTVGGQAVPTMNNQVSFSPPATGGANNLGGGTTFNNQINDATGEGSPMADLALNVGGLVEQLSQGGIVSQQNVNFDSALPIVVTVQGQVSQLITPEQVASIENAVISKLTNTRPQNNGANAPANFTPSQAASAQGLA